MAHRRVRRTRKHRYQNITALCGDWNPSPRGKTAAIHDIESNTHQHYVYEENTPTYIHIVQEGGNKQLRTTTDGASKNNLANLPHC